jgi:Na+/H+ antiporter NhaD/arsenite permease-like protein
MAKILSILVIAAFATTGVSFGSEAVQAVNVPVSLLTYETAEFGQNLSLLQILLGRIRTSPFNLVATVIFTLAVVHTFFAPKISRCAKRLHESFHANPKNENRACFCAEMCHFLGEIEVIFGLWCIPLIVAVAHNFGWSGVTSYLSDKVDFTEPIFVVVIMSMASTKPIITLAESALGCVARIGQRTPGAWWLTILAVSPLMGSLITEPAAMTIGAMLLAKKFYIHSPSNALKYATLALLFVNISVGGTLTHFAAPPVLMVANRWSLGLGEMFFYFGVRAILGIAVSTLLYFLVFRKEFKKMSENTSADNRGDEIPVHITLVHVVFMAWTVVVLHTPPLVIAGYLFLIGFMKATRHYQTELNVRNSLLVGFFLAGLVTHGGFQTWWLAPVLSSLGEAQLFLGATILTAFNDNAAVTYLASLVPAFAANVALQKAVLAGAVTGGGLTVIANAPNPAGQNILAKYFSNEISPVKLLVSAILPTIIVGACFMLL